MNKDEATELTKLRERVKQLESNERRELAKSLIIACTYDDRYSAGDAWLTAGNILAGLDRLETEAR